MNYVYLLIELSIFILGFLFIFKPISMIKWQDQIFRVKIAITNTTIMGSRIAGVGMILVAMFGFKSLP